MTRFCGHKTGFNPSGDNDVTPTFDGSTTNYKGRGALPKGKPNVPKGLASIEGSNRRVAKSRVGGGENVVRGTNAFTKGKRT